jgi:hypothetical protein
MNTPYRKIFQSLDSCPKDFWEMLFHVAQQPHHRPSGQLCDALERTTDGHINDAIIQWLDQVVVSVIAGIANELHDTSAVELYRSLAYYALCLMHTREQQLLDGADYLPPTPRRDIQRALAPQAPSVSTLESPPGPPPDAYQRLN